MLDTASSTTDPPQDTAEPISQAGGTSDKTYLRKSKTLYGGEEWGEKSVRNSPVNTKVREEGEGGDAPGTGAKNPLQPVEMAMVE